MRLFAVPVPAELEEAVAACRDHFRLAAVLSALVNILYLSPTIYMMQVYDRAVPTGGVVTLFWLTIVVGFALSTLAILDALRARVMLRASLRLDARLSTKILDGALAAGGVQGVSPSQAMRAFDNLRAAVAGTPAIALFDIVWTPIYILVAFLVHPAIGALAILSSALLLMITLASERANRAGTTASLEAMSSAYATQELVGQRAEIIRALGMRGAMITLLSGARSRALRLATEQQFGNGRFASLTKFARLFLQSMALGLGAWLAIGHQISVGGIIAASVLLSRALQPIELLVGSWANIGQARDAITTLAQLLPETSPGGTNGRFDLPAPTGTLAVQGLCVDAPPSSDRALLSEISFELKPGEFLGVIGPSGAGKTTLARVLSCGRAADRGKVRLGGSDVQDWDPEKLACHIGYLPQDTALLPGTIADNISRFAGLRGDTSAEVTRKVLEAAHMAGVHDLIVTLPGGYDRRIGWRADELSAGQRQRVALARALYGDPVLLVLDEPNSALDAEGEVALMRAISAARARGACVVMVTHRAQLLAEATGLLLLVDGVTSMMGKYHDVVQALQRANAKPALQPAEVH